MFITHNIPGELYITAKFYVIATKILMALNSTATAEVNRKQT